MAILWGDIYSESIRQTTGVRIILPEPSNDVDPIVEGEPKLLYLLHGLSANASEWTRFSKIEYYAKKYHLLVVMPEVQRTFYCDAATGLNYFQYISQELPEIVKSWIRVDHSPENTYIAGESMGGYGALKAGLTYPENYAGVGALSGALDFAAMVAQMMSATRGEVDIHQRELESVLGPGAPVREENDLIKLVEKAAKNPQRPNVIQICGTEDFLYGQNIRWKEAAEAAGYGHTYMEWEGEHAWPFWDVAIQRVIQFFCGLDIHSTEIY